MTSAEAQQKANEYELDLIKISPNAKPPVCRIIDYGKYRFDQMKKLKELKKNQKTIEIKEIQLSMTIEQHDIDIKAKHATKFLNDENKVKVVLRMRGRQQAYSQRAVEIVNAFCAQISEFGDKEKEPRIEGRNVVVMVAPKKKK